jgi:uncharacterized integral membrane protein
MSEPEHKPQKQPGKSATKRERIRTFALVTLAILMTLFAVLNLKDVKVDWIIGSGKAPLIIVIVVSVLVGAVFSYFADRRAAKRR